MGCNCKKKPEPTPVPQTPDEYHAQQMIQHSLTLGKDLTQEEIDELNNIDELNSEDDE